MLVCMLCPRGIESLILSTDVHSYSTVLCNPRIAQQNIWHSYTTNPSTYISHAMHHLQPTQKRDQLLLQTYHKITAVCSCQLTSHILGARRYTLNKSFAIILQFINTLNLFTIVHVYSITTAKLHLSTKQLATYGLKQKTAPHKKNHGILPKVITSYIHLLIYIVLQWKQLLLSTQY